MWLDEDGDLYRALDRLQPPADSAGTELIHKVFDIYYGQLKALLSQTGAFFHEPESRAGMKLRDAAVLLPYLRNYGWSVFEIDRETTWSVDVTLRWILETVLKPRAFTNLRSYPLVAHARAFRELRAWIETHARTLADQSIKLRFRASGYYAVQSAEQEGQARRKRMR